MPEWSPDGTRFVVTNTVSDGVELWLGSTNEPSLRRIADLRLNAAGREAVQWLSGSKSLLCQTIPASRGQPPVAPAAPAGPTTQESDGKRSPVRTFQDLLTDRHDEDLFDYYTTSQLCVVELDSLKAMPLGAPAIFGQADPSPDGKFLLIERHVRPYSYLLPASAFPKQVEVWDRKGTVVHRLATLPLEDKVPIEGVPTGPRSYRWHATEPSTLLWVEALDGGDPKQVVTRRDRLMMQRIPAESSPLELCKVANRFFGLTHGATGNVALLREYDSNRRWSRTYLVNLDKPELQEPLWDRSMLDRYRDPGRPVMKTLPNGQRVLWQDGDAIFLDGQGASPRGDRPFLDRFDLKTRDTKRLFQAEESHYETVLGLVSDDGRTFLMRRESPTEPPNVFMRSAEKEQPTPLTHFADPTPQLRGIKKQLVTYERADGVQLSMTLYLPADHQPGQRLPAVLWAYPREYTDPDTAGQVSGSPNRFTTLGGISHLFFLLQGYAVLDGATMPVVGDPETVNNTFIEQIVSSAKAAIDKADEMGVIDPKRVGVGGHSYGAFMTANLLAHCDLFRAGIARSGAYNRTLTPFGFQSERRTLWEAPEMYVKVSPFMVAHKINEPLLLVHGAADNNAGTFPIQSERLYHAVKGNGGIVRYVSLPHESHGYLARESVEHTLHEMVTWFDKYVKNHSR
jgi:dipeptidyl aminopeptidase/acylaminoacyl peptidase